MSNLTTGMNVIALDDYAEKLEHVTVGKVYNVRSTDDANNISIVSDDGFLRPHSPEYFVASLI